MRSAPLASPLTIGWTSRAARASCQSRMKTMSLHVELGHAMWIEDLDRTAAAVEEALSAVAPTDSR